MTSEGLEILLEKTRQALLVGDFEALEALAQQTSAALDAAQIVGPETLARVRAMADANAVLIEAALRGVSAARNRLIPAERFSTYDSRGQRDAVQAHDPSRTQRL